MTKFRDTQQVCLNGHQITASYHKYPDNRKKYCVQCGASTIHACPQCGHEIPGKTHYENVATVGFQTPVPEYCESCGIRYPWTLKDSGEAASGNPTAGPDPFSILSDLSLRFRKIVLPLLKRRKGHKPYEIKDEYDVQDLLHALLRVFFEDIRDEEFSPSCAGMNAKIDFLLLDEQIAIEVKIARDKDSEARIGEELILDVAKYKEHPSCKALFCFVYDPDHQIKNAAGLRKDVEKQGGDLTVKVIVAPV